MPRADFRARKLGAVDGPPGTGKTSWATGHAGDIGSIARAAQAGSFVAAVTLTRTTAAMIRDDRLPQAGLTADEMQRVMTGTAHQWCNRMLGRRAVVIPAPERTPWGEYRLADSRKVEALAEEEGEDARPTGWPKQLVDAFMDLHPRWAESFPAPPGQRVRLEQGQDTFLAWFYAAEVAVNMCADDSVSAWEAIRDEGVAHLPKDELDRFRDAWGAFKRDRGMRSFSDMILGAVLHLEAGGGCGYDIVFWDEVQDATPLEHRLLRALDVRELWVMGDPRQTIYHGMRVRDHEMVYDLYASADEIVNLPTTWRLPRIVFDLSHRIAAEMEYPTPDWRPREGAPAGRLVDSSEDFDIAIREAVAAIRAGHTSLLYGPTWEIARDSKDAFLEQGLPVKSVLAGRNTKAFGRDVQEALKGALAGPSAITWAQYRALAWGANVVRPGQPRASLKAPCVSGANGECRSSMLLSAAAAGQTGQQLAEARRTIAQLPERERASLAVQPVCAQVTAHLERLLGNTPFVDWIARAAARAREHKGFPNTLHAVNGLRLWGAEVVFGEPIRWGTIWSVKGDEADVCFFSPNISKPGDEAEHETKLQLAFVTVSRSRHTLVRLPPYRDWPLLPLIDEAWDNASADGTPGRQPG